MGQIHTYEDGQLYPKFAGHSWYEVYSYRDRLQADIKELTRELRENTMFQCELARKERWVKELKKELAMLFVARGIN